MYSQVSSDQEVKAKKKDKDIHLAYDKYNPPKKPVQTYKLIFPPRATQVWSFKTSLL